MAFKDTLKELRQEKKLTQDNLASMIHVSRSAIAKWEAGLGLPQEESIELLCQVFNKTKEELFKEYVEQDLVDKNIKIHSQKNRILILSFLLCVICFVVIFLTFMILNRKIETFKKEDETSITLKNQVNADGNFSPVAGSLEDFLFQSKYGYAYQTIFFEMVPFTDCSDLILIKNVTSFTCGKTAYENGEKKFDKNALIDFCELKIDFLDLNIHPIFSWPALEDRCVYVESTFSQDSCWSENFQFTEIKFNLAPKLNFLYISRVDKNILHPNKKELIRQLDYKTGMQQTRWTYENLTKYSKWVTFGMETYSLIEVKRNETSSFSFFIQTSFKNDKQITSMNRKIECFIP